MRMPHKRWKNRRGGFTHRITWYQDADGRDIRLQIETPDGLKNVYPKSKAEAQAEWDKFKNGCPV